ncbi:MAG: primosomal protein [Burkholderiales bacterium]|jgi:primosomal protein N' (replication factor Y)|nr:primosomal protein [Burkholderiales bacterium]
MTTIQSKPQIISVALDIPLYQTFSYIHDKPLANGQRVLVEFQHKKVVGFVWGEDKPTTYSPANLKPILEVYPEIIFDDIISLIKFCATYYHYPIGGVIFNALPKILKQAKPVNVSPAKSNQVPSSSPRMTSNTSPKMTGEQQAIFDDISKYLTQFHPSIIYGVTGSGKTQLYLQLINEVLKHGRQVLVLVPEINLTPQMLERFQTKFSDKNITILTSHATPRARYLGYLAAQNGHAQIIIGTRLSVFTPFANLGLIVVDEEHDQSFKQNDNLRYHARDLAIWRASQNSIPVILGSATPSLESLFNYKQGRYHLYRLNNRAVANASLPKIELVDLNFHKTNHGLTQVVIDAMKERLTRKELSMVFINRRGYSPILSCNECGWVSTCKQCSTTMVYHKVNHNLKCHHCGYTLFIPPKCPSCSSQYLQALGDGTQKIEAIIEEFFPDARIERIDQDTTNTKSSWNDLYTKINNNEIDILVGTQMLAKGHDFHNLTLVVGLNIDSGLYSYDFRASELLFTQLTQVAGRSGRGDKKGQVLLQTKYPGHELYQYLITNDSPGFINYLLLQRKNLHLPPYIHYAMFRASGREIAKVMDYLQSVAKLMQKIAIKGVTINPAVPSVIQRLKNKERAQILIQSLERQQLHMLFDKLLPLLQQMKPKYSITWIIDIDPYEV